MLHFSLYGGTHEQIQRNRPDIRPPDSPAPQSGGMGADAQNDLRLLEAQFLRGNALYAPEPESGNVRNHRSVEQYRAVHKTRRAFHSGFSESARIHSSCTFSMCARPTERRTIPSGSSPIAFVKKKMSHLLRKK